MHDHHRRLMGRLSHPTAWCWWCRVNFHLEAAGLPNRVNNFTTYVVRPNGVALLCCFAQSDLTSSSPRSLVVGVSDVSSDLDVLCTLLHRLDPARPKPATAEAVINGARAVGVPTIMQVQTTYQPHATPRVCLRTT